MLFGNLLLVKDYILSENLLFGFFHDYGRLREQGGNSADSRKGRREQNTYHAD